MEDQEDFTAGLEQAISQRKQVLEQNEMAKLKENYSLLHKSFGSFYNVLMQKGLIREDPYKSDQMISDVKAPPSSPFLESEKIDKISQRLSEYESQLDFLINYYQFSLDFLDLKRIKDLVGLTKYIQWSKLSPNSNNMNTRVVAELYNKITQGTDPLSISLLADALGQLTKAQNAIMALFKVITDFQREVYKLDLRERVFSKIALKQDAVLSDQERALRDVKRAFAEEMPERPFFPELVREIFMEDFSAQSDFLRSELLKKLAVKERKVEKREVSFKPVLLEAVRALGGAGTHLEQAIIKLQENVNIIESKKLTFGEKFDMWFRQLIQGSEKTKIYEVDYFDPVTSVSKTMKINFQQFQEDTMKKVRILGALSNKMSTTYRRLEASEEERIYKFLEANMSDIQDTMRKLPALDTFFKSEVSRENRNKIRGIKLEITALKNAIVKANQKRHEYVSQKEESEQLKRLGVDMSVK